MDLMVLDSIPGEGDIYRISPEQPRGPSSFLFNGYPGSFPGAKKLRRGAKDRGMFLPLIPSTGPPRTVTGRILRLQILLPEAWSEVPTTQNEAKLLS